MTDILESTTHGGRQGAPIDNQPRALHVIAREIRDTWKPINYAAKPYHAAMLELDKITDQYYHDDAKSIVLYFLANAQTWRGENARRIKKELRALIA